MRRLAAQLVLLAVGAAAALLAGELLLRVFYRSAPQLELDIYAKAEDGELALRPDLTRRHVTPLWDVQIRLNDAGMRDDAPAPAAGATVWLGLGDSQAFGWGVEQEESFYSRIGERFGVRLVNAATPGTGPIDHVRRLRRLAGRWRTPVILEAVFVGNDFTDVALGGAAQYDVRDGLLLRKPALGEPGVDSWRSVLARRSRLAQLVRAVQFNWSRAPEPTGPPRNWDGWMREFAQVHLAEPNPRTRRAESELLEALDEMLAIASREAAELVVIVIPRSIQVYPAELERMRAALGVAPAALDPDRPQRLLTGWAADRGATLVDPLERMRRAAQQGERLYFTPNAHLTSAGHGVIAEETLAVLRAAGIPR